MATDTPHYANNPPPDGGPAPALARVTAALDSLRSTIALDSRDWSCIQRDAWIYGIVLGWDSDEGSAMDELAARFGWGDEAVGRLRDHAAAFAALPSMLADRAALMARVAALEAALVEERARGNWGAEGNIDWEEQASFVFGHGDDEIGVQDFYRRDARAQLVAEGLLPGAGGDERGEG